MSFESEVREQTGESNAEGAYQNRDYCMVKLFARRPAYKVKKIAVMDMAIKIALP